MIDYKKLEEVDQLAKKKHKDTPYQVTILNLGDDQEPEFRFSGLDFIDYCKIDELIKKLRKLSKPEPKYKIGDIVFKMGNKNNIVVSEIKDRCGRLYLLSNMADITFPENELYPSREALIDAQISYWQSFKDDALVLGDKADGFVVRPMAKGELDEIKKDFAVASDIVWVNPVHEQEDVHKESGDEVGER